VRKSLAILVLGLLLTGAGCPTAEHVAAPTPAPVTATPAQPVQGDANAFAVANGTLSYSIFTIAIPKGGRAEGGASGRIDLYPEPTSDFPARIGEGQYFVEFSEIANIDDALAAFKTEYKTRTVTELAGRKVAYGSGREPAAESTLLGEGYVVIVNGESALVIRLSADTKSGMDAARAFVQTIHWTDQN